MSQKLEQLAGRFVNIKVDVEDSIATVTMNRPQALNALNHQTLEELGQLLDCLAGEADILGLIITGEGRGFVAGADIIQIKDYGSEEGRKYFGFAQQVLSKIESLEKPVIAAVNGFALGGGCEMALCCDIRIASDKAVFGQPEVDLAVTPAFGGSQRLPRLIGVGKAKEIIFTGRKVKADEALAIGLVNLVVPHERLMDEARAMMKVIVGKGPIAIRYAKVMINKGMDMDLMNALELEKDLSALTYATEDKKEGMNAFAEKRSPTYKGR